MVFLRNSGPYGYGGGIVLNPMPNWDFFPAMDPFFNDGIGYFENPFHQRRPSCRHPQLVRELERTPNQNSPIFTDDRRGHKGRRNRFKPVEEDDEMMSSDDTIKSSLPMSHNTQRRGARMDHGVEEIPILMDGKIGRRIPGGKNSKQNHQGRNLPCKEPCQVSEKLENSPEFENIQTKQNELSNSETTDSFVSSEKPSQLEPQLELLKRICDDLDALENRIASFKGVKTDREYLTIDELLTRALLELDSIDSQGCEEIRQRRKELVIHAYSLVERLEHSVSDVENASKEDNKMDADSIADTKTDLNKMNCDSSVDDEIDGDDDDRLELPNFIDQC